MDWRWDYPSGRLYRFIQTGALAWDVVQQWIAVDVERRRPLFFIDGDRIGFQDNPSPLEFLWQEYVSWAEP